MQQELAFLVSPIFVSLLLVSCLKTHFRFKKDLPPNRDEVYVKTAPVGAEIERRKPKKVVKPEKKAKKVAQLFVAHKKDEKKLKTPISSELSLDFTQSGSNSDDDEHESPIDSFVFSDVEEREEMGGVRILPPPPNDYVAGLKARVRRGKRGKKSPQDYLYADEEDSLFNVESLQMDPLTLQSSKSAIPLDIQDSRVLRTNQRLGYKKSHTVYPNSDESTGSSIDITLRHSN